MAHKDYTQEKNVNQASLGQFGIRVLKAGMTSLPGETYIAIQGNEPESIFNSDLVPNGDDIGDDKLVNQKIVRDSKVVGRFTNISVVSGEIYCFKG